MGQDAGRSPQGSLRRCSRCVLPETYPGIEFDAGGLCSQCAEHGRDEKEPLGAERLRQLVEPYRGRGGKYDAGVALSGGRDSTFTLHYAVKVLGLKVLAFTVDNGFMPQETCDNVATATRILGVDHVFVRSPLLEKTIPSLLSAWLGRPSPAMISLMCLGCRLGMRRGYLEVARKHHIRLCLSGSGEPEKSFAMAFFKRSPGKGGRGLAMLKGLAREMLANPRYLAHPRIPLLMVGEFLYEYPPNRLVWKLVHPGWQEYPLFRYIPWDEQRIMAVIESEMGWKRYRHSRSAWRSDCKINLLKNQLYLATLGFTKNDELVSGMIRRGLIGRPEGLARLEHDNVIGEDFLAELFEELGLSFEKAKRRFPALAAGPVPAPPA